MSLLEPTFGVPTVASFVGSFVSLFVLFIGLLYFSLQILYIISGLQSQVLLRGTQILAGLASFFLSPDKDSGRPFWIKS